MIQLNQNHRKNMKRYNPLPQLALYTLVWYNLDK
nr:MAG TPA: hypothetical protein [Caudoviricetes sp.]